MELAQLEQEYQQYQEKVGHGIQQGNSMADSGKRRFFTHDRDGRLRNLLKKTYLRCWIGASDIGVSEEEAHLNTEGNFSSRRFNSIDLARWEIICRSIFR